MSNVVIEIKSTPTFRDLHGRFAKAEAELIEIRREQLRNEGRVFVPMIQRNLRAKIGPSKIEQGVRFNTRTTGGNIQLHVTAPGRARPHIIRAKNKGALAFFWPKVGMMTFVPKRGGFRTHVSRNELFIGKGYVNHPGGSLVPLLSPIMQKSKNDWMSARGRAVLRSISTRYVEAIKK